MHSPADGDVAMPTPSAAPRHVPRISVAAGAIARALADTTATIATSAPQFDSAAERADVRRRVRRGEAGTYIGEILRERDSALARWPDRRGKPLGVWIEPSSNVAQFTAGYVTSVRAAFAAWDSLRLPVRFSFVRDPENADVHVRFIDHFDEPISGRTRWTRDDNWTITNASITLAVHHVHGELLDDDAMRAIALHEIGHLLGLDHTRDSLSVMAPRVSVRELADADRATARLLYALPAGSVR